MLQDNTLQEKVKCSVLKYAGFNNEWHGSWMSQTYSVAADLLLTIPLGLGLRRLVSDEY